MAKRRSKPKIEKFDGLNDQDKKNIRRVLRQAWSWSYSRRLVVKRCTLPNGFARCEKCRERCPIVKVDHIKQVGDVGPNYIAKLFVPSNKMQGLCKKCHDKKTKEERKAARKAKPIDDFY